MDARGVVLGDLPEAPKQPEQSESKEYQGYCGNCGHPTDTLPCPNCGGDLNILEQPPAAKEQPQENTEAAQPTPVMETAFIVFMQPGGHWMASSDISIAETLQFSRPATIDDMYSAAGMIQKDIEVRETAQTAVVMQQQAIASMTQQVVAGRAQEALARAAGMDETAAKGAFDLSPFMKR